MMTRLVEWLSGEEHLQHNQDLEQRVAYVVAQVDALKVRVDALERTAPTPPSAESHESH